MSNSAVSSGGLTGQFFINDRKIVFTWVVDNPSQYSYYEIMINQQIYTTRDREWTINNVFPGSYTAKVRGNVTCGRTLWSDPVTVIANYPPPTFLKNLFTRVHTHIEYEWEDLNYDVYELDLDGVILTKKKDELTHTKELVLPRIHKARVRGKISMFNFTTDWSNYVDTTADYPGTSISNLTFNRENFGSEFLVEWIQHPDAYQYEIEWVPQFRNLGTWQPIRLFEPVLTLIDKTKNNYEFSMLKLGFNYEFRIRVIYKKFDKADIDANKMFSVWSDTKSFNPLYKPPILTQIKYNEASDEPSKSRFIDFELDLSAITPKFYRILRQFAPFGPQNMAPVFSTSAVHDSGYGKCVGQDDKHLKISVYKNNTIPLNSIGFGLGSKLGLVQNKTPFDIAYAVEENEWNGQVSLQLKLKDIKP